MENVREKAKPYLYEVGNKLVILVHGFTGSPDDMREIAKYLAGKGFSAKAIRLAGHGTSDWQDMEKTSYYDWWKTLVDEVRNAEGKYSKVFIVGYSFGSNLALDVAARYPDLVDGVVCLGISVFLKRELLARFLLPIFHFFLKRYKKGYVKKEHQTEYLDSGSHLYIPSKSVYDFYNFIDRYTKRELGRVKTPVLIIHSRDDLVTNPKSSEYAHARLGSVRKELLILDDVNHNPIRSQRKNLIFSKVEDFLSSL